MDVEDARDRIRGSLIGGAIGDALGYQIEFEMGVKPKQIMRFKDSVGIISDDTQMTLFTAVALIWRETRWAIRGIAMLPHEAVYLGYRDWLSTQQRVSDRQQICWITELRELNVLRDPGMTCLEALSSGKAGDFAEPINDSKGCGGIMRVAPVGLFIRNDDEAGEIAARTCALTHGHPLAILSAYTLGLVIYYVRSGFEIEKAVSLAVAKMNDWQPEAYKDSKKLKVDWDLEKDELTDLIDKAVLLASTDYTEQVAIKKLGAGWVAEEALAIAIYAALKYADDFEGAVVAAINHDGDSDSTGAITGNIVGAKVGYKNIPDYYKNNVELKEVILEIADDLTTGVPTEKDGQVVDKKWLKKYWENRWP